MMELYVYIRIGLQISQEHAPSAPDLDGGGPGAKAWWEAQCVDTKFLDRG